MNLICFIIGVFLTVLYRQILSAQTFRYRQIWLTFWMAFWPHARSLSFIIASCLGPFGIRDYDRLFGDYLRVSLLPLTDRCPPFIGGSHSWRILPGIGDCCSPCVRACGLKYWKHLDYVICWFDSLPQSLNSPSTYVFSNFAHLHFAFLIS